MSDVRSHKGGMMTCQACRWERETGDGRLSAAAWEAHEAIERAAGETRALVIALAVAVLVAAGLWWWLL